MWIWGTGERVLTDAGQLQRSAGVLWSLQFDAAAKDEDDCVLRGSGGARVTGESRVEEDEGKRGE